MKRSVFVTFYLIFILVHISFTKENESSEKLIAVKAQEKIIVDGILNEQTWMRTGFTNMKQQDPDQGMQPSQKSELWLAYDDEAVYFAAKFYDNNPDSIMARLVRRDFVWGDPSDGCVLYFDTYRDKRNGYFFYVSAAGTIADGLLENDTKQTDLSWDAVWEGVPRLYEDGWCVEMKIPFSQLRFADNDVQIWGVNVERFISRRVETDMIAYTPRNESGFASRFPELVGIEGIKPSARVELLPYVTGKAEYIQNAPGDPFNSGENYLSGTGLDFKAGLGSSLTLDATLNPDFGQVEVDPAIVNLTDVEYTFQEKRPFFTEGVSIFRFGRGGTNNNVTFNWSNPNIFYSRRIGRSPQGALPSYDYADIPDGTRILAAGKISGRLLNNWKIGTIHALTRKEFAQIDVKGKSFESEIEPMTYYGIFRAQRDFQAGKHGFGVLSTYTNRFFDDKSLRNDINKNAFVFATDGWTFLDADRTYVLTGWLAGSRVAGNKNRITNLQYSSAHYFQRPDADHVHIDTSANSLAGYAGRLILNKNRGRFTFNTALGFISPEFEVNDLGYNSFSDRINSHFYTNYNWADPTEYYRNAGINAATFASFDFGGNKTAHGYRIGSYINFLNFYGGNISYFYYPQFYDVRRTRGGPLTINPGWHDYYLNMYSDFRKWWVAYLGLNYKHGKDTKARGVYTQIELKTSTSLTFTFGPQFSKRFYNAQWITAYKDPAAQKTFGTRYIFANLDQTTLSTDIRADWIINPKLSFQVYVQPFMASGKYYNFKSLKKSKSYDFLIYGQNGSSVDKTTSENGRTYYLLDPDGTGPAEAKTINNPDFNYISLRGNAVLRWEYMPGSTLYLVWTQSMSSFTQNGDFYFDRSMNQMFELQPDNIFMLKLSYWLGI